MPARFTYLPQIGVLIMVTWTAAETVGPRALLGATAVAAVAGCVALTTRQLEVWRDSVSLFAHATAVTRDNHVAAGNLGAPLPDPGPRVGRTGRLGGGGARCRPRVRSGPGSGDPAGHPRARAGAPGPPRGGGGGVPWGRAAQARRSDGALQSRRRPGGRGGCGRGRH